MPNATIGGPRKRTRSPRHSWVVLAHLCSRTRQPRGLLCLFNAAHQALTVFQSTPATSKQSSSTHPTPPHPVPPHPVPTTPGRIPLSPKPSQHHTMARAALLALLVAVAPGCSRCHQPLCRKLGRLCLRGPQHLLPGRPAHEVPSRHLVQDRPARPQRDPLQPDVPAFWPLPPGLGAAVALGRRRVLPRWPHLLHQGSLLPLPCWLCLQWRGALPDPAPVSTKQTRNECEP